MARKLQLSEWVKAYDHEDEVVMEGFIVENLGNGFWNVYSPSAKVVDTFRSNKLERMDVNLEGSDYVIIDRLLKSLENEFRHEAINKAIDAKDYDTLKKLYNQ